MVLLNVVCFLPSATAFTRVRGATQRWVNGHCPVWCNRERRIHHQHLSKGQMWGLIYFFDQEAPKMS